MRSCPAGSVINDHKIWYADKIYGYCAKCSDGTDLGCWGEKMGSIATPKATRYISGRKTPYSVTMLNNSGVATVNSNKFNKICPANMVFNGINVITKNNKIKDIDYSCGNVSKAYCDKNPNDKLCTEFKPVLVPETASAMSKLNLKCPPGTIVDKHKVYAGDHIGTVCLGCSDGTDLGCYGLPSVGSFNHTLGVTNSISVMRSPENELNAMYGVNGLLLGKGTEDSEKVTYTCPNGTAVNGFSGNFGDMGLYNVDYNCGQIPVSFCDANPNDPICSTIDTENIIPETTATNIGARKLSCAPGHHINKMIIEGHNKGLNYMCLECSDDVSLGCYGYTKNDGTKKSKYGLFKQIDGAVDKDGKVLRLLDTPDVGGDNKLTTCPKGQYLNGANFDVFGDDISNLNFKCGNVYPFLLPISEYNDLGKDPSFVYTDSNTTTEGTETGTTGGTATTGGTTNSTAPVVLDIPAPVNPDPVPLSKPQEPSQDTTTETPNMMLWVVLLILIVLIASYYNSMNRRQNANNNMQNNK